MGFSFLFLNHSYIHTLTGTFLSTYSPSKKYENINKKEDAVDHMFHGWRTIYSHVQDGGSVGYQVFLRALHQYAKARMRFGR